MHRQFGQGSARLVLLLALLPQRPSAGSASLSSYGCWLSAEPCEVLLHSASAAGQLRLIHSLGSEFWVQEEEGRTPRVCSCRMAQSQLRFQRWPNRLYLWMEGATKSCGKGTLIEKSTSLPTGPRKAMINQEKNTWSEGHTLETLRQSDIWPSVH